MLPNLKLNKKHFLFVFILGCILMIFQMISHLQVPSNEKKSRITILLWHWPFRVPYSLQEDTCLNNYNIFGCHMVDDRRHYSTADIVVFHHHELLSGFQKLPLHLPRPVYQRWLWLSLESPQNNGDLKKYDGMFNLTMTYHPNADITIPYGKLIEKDGDSVTDDFFIPKNKTHLVCWVVSNYQKHHKRTEVYQKLNQIIPVQVYGRAVGKPLSQGSLLPTISRCYFYLAFENSESPHYITEKLWRNSFMAGTVPVVLGAPRSHYEAVAPPHSFIHVEDFTSVSTLATFLKDTAEDEERYKWYFSWHANYTVKLYADWRDRLCRVCQVYDKLPSHKIYHKLGLI